MYEQKQFLNARMEEDKQFVCGMCYRQFKYNYTLTKHLRGKHPTEAPPVKERKGFLCPICGTRFSSSDCYMEHLSEKHNIALEKEKIEFTSLGEFYTWKKAMENNHRYVQSRGGRTQLNGFNVTVYECHRSGMYVSRGEGKRKLKNQGSKKINGLCPAKIKASVSEKGIVSVEFIKTHVGHDSGEEHILLSNEEREILADMIKSKASFDEIIDTLKNKPEVSKRLQSVTKKDLHNIVCSYKLKEFVTFPPKKVKKVRLKNNDEIRFNQLNETTTSTEILSENNEVTPDVIFFQQDQNIIGENIFILDLNDSTYTAELSFEKEKYRIKNEFLDMLESLNTREQLESLKNALIPFLPNLQAEREQQTIDTAIDAVDLNYSFANFLSDKATIKICP